MARSNGPNVGFESHAARANLRSRSMTFEADTKVKEQAMADDLNRDSPYGTLPAR